MNIRTVVVLGLVLVSASAFAAQNTIAMGQAPGNPAGIPASMDPNSDAFVDPGMGTRDDEESIVVEKAATSEAKTTTPQPREIPTIEAINASRSHADVTFVTGGIGDDEKRAIEAAKADYNVHVMSASMRGAFVGDARVAIFRKAGDENEEMLNAVAGPLFYVRLPAGSYTLVATLGAQTRTQSFVVRKKGAPTNIHLSWKANS